MKKRILLIGLMTTLSTHPIHAQEKTRLVTDRSLELTGFQDPRPYTPAYDLRNDFVMVYGIQENRIPALQSWIERRPPSTTRTKPDSIVPSAVGLAYLRPPPRKPPPRKPPAKPPRASPARDSQDENAFALP
jgi:hypothetical protein